MVWVSLLRIGPIRWKRYVLGRSMRLASRQCADYHFERPLDPVDNDPGSEGSVQLSSQSIRSLAIAVSPLDHHVLGVHFHPQGPGQGGTDNG